MQSTTAKTATASISRTENLPRFGTAFIHKIDNSSRAGGVQVSNMGDVRLYGKEDGKKVSFSPNDGSRNIITRKLLLML